MQQKTNAAVDALVLNSALATTQALYAVPNPKITLDVAARTDVKVSTADTGMLRYALHKVKQSNVGVGQLALESQGQDERTFIHTLQLGNTLVISPKIVDETRLQYVRVRTTETPESTAPTLLVQGAFSGGGNPQGQTILHQDRVELQEYVSIALDRHFVSVGGRVRVARDASFSRAHFNGEFVFPNLGAYETMLAGIAAGWNADKIAAAGGGADEYVVADGDPSASVIVADGAIFAEDNWKLRQNLKLSYGVRFETQNFIADHADWAPRVGFSWGVDAAKGGAPRYVVHGGAGVFYHRFGTTTALNVSRFNGTRHLQYVVQSPKFCPPTARPRAVMVNAGCASAPPPATLSAVSGTTVYKVNPDFRAPSYIEGSLGIDRQLGNRGSVGLTYLQTRGVHTQYAENANAPLPGTYVFGQPASGSRPFGNSLNVFQYESEGLLRTRQATANAALRSGRFSLIGHYTLQFSNSDAESNGTFPLNRFDMTADYSRSAADVRHAGVVTGGLNLPYGIASWATLNATSGAPFNIVLGEDLNGDTQYNDRPAFATDLSRPGVVRTQWGVFDADPIAGQTIIPRNYGQGPGSLSLNLTVGKVYVFGRQANTAVTQGPAEPKYSAELWVLALNVLNHPNLVQPVAVLGTPLFGRSVGVTSNGSLSPARALDMQIAFRF
jgi:hypothetical protein